MESLKNLEQPGRVVMLWDRVAAADMDWGLSGSAHPAFYIHSLIF